MVDTLNKVLEIAEADRRKRQKPFEEWTHECSKEGHEDVWSNS